MHKDTEIFWRSFGATRLLELSSALQWAAYDLKGVGHPDDQVLKYLRESAQLAEESDDPMQCRIALQFLAGAYALYGQFDEARRAMAKMDSIPSPTRNCFQEVILSTVRLAAEVHMGDLRDPTRRTKQLVKLCEVQGWEHQAEHLRGFLKQSSHNGLRRHALGTLE